MWTHLLDTMRCDCQGSAKPIRASNLSNPWVWSKPWNKQGDVDAHQGEQQQPHDLVGDEADGEDNVVLNQPGARSQQGEKLLDDDR